MSHRAGARTLRSQAVPLPARLSSRPC